ncbi:protein FAR1-RELATED SEQUENCE 11-like [Rutidosis leptorrhynchoides]|uniref:protein FAR1-RELATED SEQUENCE 11-like n=1 Tax=Rutidosis leptorrhynchoides TaxID=125765 RepID=UPI003A99DB1C
MKKLGMIDLNEIPLEDSIIIEQEGGNIEDGENESLDIEEPFVGQCFLSEEEAFAFYQNYARKNGFSIRKRRFVNKDGEKSRRDFFCHREGKPKPKMIDYTKQQRNRVCTVCECNAHMRISLRRINEIFPKEWQVTKFVLEHNHDLLSPQEVQFLPSYRSITSDDENHILLLKEGGLSIRQIMRVMELEKGVRHEELDFLKKDVSNYISKHHKQHSNNDARELLEYCKNAKIENSNFQYAFTLDSDNRLQHIFCAHVHCFDMYQEYGDVVVFDTTYKVNLYDVPLEIFVGVDNHGRTILFVHYLREFFFGGMTTTGRSESINAFIKKFISSNTCLSDFIRKVDLVVKDVQQKQMHDTMLQKYKGSNLRSLSPLEEQGYGFLTPFYFRKFQEQFGLAMQYSVEGIQYSSHEEKTIYFIVKHQKATRCHNVIWNGKLPRWSRKDRQGAEICSLSHKVIHVDSNATCSDEVVVVDAIDLVQCPIKSKTKGRPKQKRMKSGKELAK